MEKPVEKPVENEGKKVDLIAMAMRRIIDEQDLKPIDKDDGSAKKETAKTK